MIKGEAICESVDLDKMWLRFGLNLGHILRFGLNLGHMISDKFTEVIYFVKEDLMKL